MLNPFRRASGACSLALIRSLGLCTLLAAAAACTPACAAAAAGGDPLASLYPQHPRLLFHQQEMAAIRKAVASDPFVAAWYKQQLAMGEKLLTTPASVYVIEGPEHTLLATARNLEGRIFTLAGLYRINGDRRFADRAIQEMLATAAFPDRYPTHFLDDAEITAALGLGYDWLYDVLTPEQRTHCAQPSPPRAWTSGSSASTPATPSITSTTTGTRFATAARAWARWPSPKTNPSARAASSTTPTTPSPTS